MNEIADGPSEDGFCPNPLGDGQHCYCWWDCHPCCGCDFDGGGKDCDCERHTLLRGETWIP